MRISAMVEEQESCWHFAKIEAFLNFDPIGKGDND